MPLWLFSERSCGFKVYKRDVILEKLGSGIGTLHNRSDYEFESVTPLHTVMYCDAFKVRNDIV